MPTPAEIRARRRKRSTQAAAEQRLEAFREQTDFLSPSIAAEGFRFRFPEVDTRASRRFSTPVGDLTTEGAQEDILRALNAAGELFDPETGRPLRPITRRFRQELASQQAAKNPIISGIRAAGAQAAATTRITGELTGVADVGRFITGTSSEEEAAGFTEGSFFQQSPERFAARSANEKDEARIKDIYRRRDLRIGKPSLATAVGQFVGANINPLVIEGKPTLLDAVLMPIPGAGALIGPTTSMLMRRIRLADDLVLGMGPAFVGENVMDAAAIPIRLTKRNEIGNIVKQTLREVPLIGKHFDIPDASEFVTGALVEKARLYQVATSRGSTLGQEARSRLKVFGMDKEFRITDLADVDAGLGFGKSGVKRAPTVQDVAARLPLYWNALNDNQRQTMEWLRGSVPQWGESMRDVGLDVGQRADIIDGGFYIPRNKVIDPEDLFSSFDNVAGVGTAGKSSAQRAASHSSMSEGIEAASEAGKKYSSPFDAMQDFVEVNGRRIADQHIRNFFTEVIDPATGARIAETAADRVSPAFRTMMDRLRARIRSKRLTLIGQRIRTSQAGREAGRRLREGEQALGRAITAEGRVATAQVLVSPEAIKAASADVREAISLGQSLSRDLAQNIEQLKRAKGLKRADEKALAKTQKALTKALEGEDAAWQALGNPLESANTGAKVLERDLARSEKLVDAIQDAMWAALPGADDVARKVDGLANVQAGLKGMKNDIRRIIPAARKTEQIMRENSVTLKGLRREFRLFDREFKRTTRLSVSADNRLATTVKRQEVTTEAFDDLRKEMTDIQSRWQAHLTKAAQVPEGQARIANIGLDGFSFPDAIANSANDLMGNTVFKKGLALQIPGVRAINNQYRSLKATLDLSGSAIQGLLGLGSNQKAWAQAMKVQFLSLGSDRVFGSYLTHFNESRQAVGRLGADAWANARLRIAGDATEFQFGEGIGLANAPLIKQANRAFGVMGDTLRLEWADDLLMEQMQKTGKTAQELIRQGEVDRIATIVNRMTGYTSNTSAGSLGDALLFAPRFLQARLETLGKGILGLRPGATLDERIARRALLKTIGYSTMFTVGVNTVRGEETDFNPVKDGRPNPNFLRIRNVFGRDWSLLGTWDGLARAITTVGTGNPTQAIRSLGSGVLANVWDILAITSDISDPFARAEELEAIFLDDPDEATKAQQVALRLMENFVPFSGTEVAESLTLDNEDVGLVATGLSIAGGILGVKSSPLSPSERLGNVRKDAMERMGLPGEYQDDLDFIQKLQVNDDPKVKEAIEKRNKRSLEFGSEYRIYENKRQDIIKEADSKINTAAVDAGWSPEEGFPLAFRGKEFRERMSDILEDKHEDMDTLRRDERSEEGLSFLDNLDPSELPLDVARRDYARAVLNPGLYNDTTNEFNFDLRDRLISQVRAKHGDAAIDKVIKAMRRDDHKAIQQLREDQESMKIYFGLTKLEMERQGQLDTYDRWRKADVIDKADIELNNVSFNIALGIARANKISYRIFNPDVEELLFRWGYVTSAQSAELDTKIKQESNRRRQAELEERQAVTP